MIDCHVVALARAANSGDQVANRGAFRTVLTMARADAGGGGAVNRKRIEAQNARLSRGSVPTFLAQSPISAVMSNTDETD